MLRRQVAIFSQIGQAAPLRAGSQFQLTLSQEFGGLLTIFPVRNVSCLYVATAETYVALHDHIGRWRAYGKVAAHGRRRRRRLGMPA